ncbi:2-phospho-L-lactate guanylyltransferase [Rhodococcus aerolatus]
MPTPPEPPPGVRVVVAAKALPQAKSRLVGGLPGPLRTPLVLAVLTDTVRAALRCPVVSAVAVVTADDEVAATVRRLGADVVDEPDAGGLNAAVVRGVAAGSGWVAALQGDLPALRPDELAAALAAARAGGGRSCVTDADGTGTTLLAGPGELTPAFGPGSAAAHRASGARWLDGAWPGLRRDVDTPADLAVAVRLGVGYATAAVLAASGTAATVAEAGPGAVVVRDDTGAARDVPAAAVAAGGWRGLRVGQRVRVHLDADGGVFLVTVPGLVPPG